MLAMVSRVSATFSRDLSVMGIKRDMIIAKSGPRIGGGYYSVREKSGLFIYMGKE